MNTYLKLLLACLPLLLTACGYTKQLHSGYFAEKQIKLEQLNDGTQVKVGPVEPTDSWLCRRLDSKKFNWAMIKLKSMNINSFGYLKKEALIYANEKHLKPNYIYLFIPDTVTVGDINATVMSDAEAFYFQCKNLNPL